MTKLPYEVLSSRSDGCLASFATFELALAYYRGYVEACGIRNAPRVVNIDRVDGAEDSRCRDGLTEAERATIEEVS
jgi:hypothetical protein